MSDFESELDQELHRILDPIVSAPIPARRAVATGGWRLKLLGGAGAALTVKVLTGVAVAAVAATVAGAATEVATTGSLNPLVWGQQVKQTVEQCKDTLRASGTRGIGKCVSEFANQHGATNDKPSAHGNNDNHAMDKGKDNGKDNGKGHGNGPEKTPGQKPRGGQMQPGPPPARA